MIYFWPGWNTTAIGVEARRGDRGVSRMGIAGRLSEATAREIIEKAAELGARSGDANFDGYFAGNVQSNGRVMTVEKGLHQEEGDFLDASSHITLRRGFLNQRTGAVTPTRNPAYHLYIAMIDPPLGKSSYSLKPEKLTVQVGRNAFALDLSGLGTFG